MSEKLKLADAYYAVAADLERQADSLNSAALICAKMADLLVEKSMAEKGTNNQSKVQQDPKP